MGAGSWEKELLPLQRGDLTNQVLGRETRASILPAAVPDSQLIGALWQGDYMEGTQRLALALRPAAPLQLLTGQGTR